MDAPISAEKTQPVQRHTSRTDSGNSVQKEKVPSHYDPEGVEGQVVAEDREPQREGLYRRFRPFILAGCALVILGWWISATVLQATRRRWIVQTLFAWAAIFIIAFRYVPNRVVTKPVGAVWGPLVATPWSKVPRWAQLSAGWLALLGIVFGTAFGFPLIENSTYGDRAINVLGLFLFQLGFWATSKHRSRVPWQTVIVGLFLQQVIALFVLKTGAGFSIFRWVAQLAEDFLGQALVGAEFFFDKDVIVEKHWFFVNVLSTIIFFIAFVQMMYYLGAMQWVIAKFAWFFFKLMNVSGAEAVVAAASPWIGQGESACLVKPYVDLMTESELHLSMTSGFSTISGSVFGAYILLGVPAANIITSSVMSIPASMAISKMRIPETDVPVTLGRISIDRGEDEKDAPVNALHAFSKGAIFGLVVAGYIFANVLTVIALVALINGLLTWIGKGFGIEALTLQLVLGYIFYPISFLIGVPRAEILTVSRLLATKLVANEFAAYLELKAIMESNNPLSHRAHTIATYALCGFANLGSLGIQIGVLGALAPSKVKIIATIAGSAMICGFLATLQTAGIVGMLV